MVTLRKVNKTQHLTTTKNKSELPIKAKEVVMKNEILKAILIGLFLFVLTVPSYAQWAVVEVNSTNQLIQQTQQTFHQMSMVQTQNLSLGKQIAEYARLSQNWLTEVQHYVDEIFQMARQFTTLRGVLGIAEKQLGIDQDKLNAAAEFIDGIRAMIAVKEQFETLLQTRLDMVRNWESRAKNGIFNPQADWQDLKNYLKTGLGRTSADEDALLGKISQIDPEFARWQDDLDRLRKKETELMLERDQIRQDLDRERELAQRPREVITDDEGNSTVDQRSRVTSSTERIYQLNNSLQAKEQLLLDVRVRIQELLDKINTRYSQLFWQMYDQWEKSANVQESGQSWTNFGNIKIEKLGEIVDSNGEPVPDVEVNPDGILQ